MKKKAKIFLLNSLNHIPVNGCALGCRRDNVIMNCLFVKYEAGKPGCIQRNPFAVKDSWVYAMIL